MDPTLSEEAARLGVVLTPKQAERLERYEELLRDRGVPNGLISASDLPRLRARHLLDCLRAVSAVEDSDHDAYDLGSGAGLPGIVVAVAAPWLSVSLVDARRGRAAFLEFAVERLSLGNARVTSARIETLSDPADLCFARALAPLRVCWELARGLLRPGGRLVYFAGEGVEGAEPLPGARSARVLHPGPLESAGPLVIMARQ